MADFTPGIITAIEAYMADATRPHHNWGDFGVWASTHGHASCGVSQRVFGEYLKTHGYVKVRVTHPTRPGVISDYRPCDPMGVCRPDGSVNSSERADGEIVEPEGPIRLSGSTPTKVDVDYMELMHTTLDALFKAAFNLARMAATHHNHEGRYDLSQRVIEGIRDTLDAEYKAFKADVFGEK